MAEEILTAIFGGESFSITIVNQVNDLKSGDKVLFLSFRKIKLYRKMHTYEIEALIALNNLVLDSMNRKIFYDKYPDLINYFKQMQVGFI